MLSLSRGEFSGHVTNSTSLNGIICAQTTYVHTQLNQARHFHENTHLSFVLSGFCAEKKKEVYERHPGHFTFYRAGEPHQMVASCERSTHVNIEIQPEFFERYDLQESNLEFVKHCFPDLKFLMIKLHQEMFDVDTPSFETLLLELLSGTADNRKSGFRPQWVLLAEDYLQANCLNQISLSDFAIVTGVHPVTISKYFRAYFGSTLGDYLRKLKVEQALSLVKTGSVSLSQIAYECGFADQSHFTRTFKQYTGMLPSAYQQI